MSLWERGAAKLREVWKGQGPSAQPGYWYDLRLEAEKRMIQGVLLEGFIYGIVIAMLVASARGCM